MTISSSTRKAGPFVGTGLTTVFPFDYKVFSDTDVLVVETDDLLVERTLELGPDYTVALSTDQENDPGGSVILAAALADNYLLTLGSQVPQTQPVELTNAGGFYPRVINQAFDRLTILIQQLAEQMGRTLKLPFSTDIDATFPLPVANGIIGFNSDASGMTVISPTDLVTVAGYADARIELFEGDGDTTDFVIDFNPGVLANLDVSISGVVQVAGVDFTWSGVTVIFATAPFDGAAIQVRYARPITPLPDYDGYLEAVQEVEAFRDALEGPDSADMVNYEGRTVAAKLGDVVSLKDFGALGDGLANDTAAFEAALAYVESLPRGGGIYIPAGRYVMDMDLSKTTQDFEKRLTITGAGRGATQIWPTDTNAIVVNMTGRNITSLRDLTIYAGDQYAAGIGILLARSTGSPNCNTNNFYNVEITGNFEQVPVLSLAAENGVWNNCRFSNNNPANDHCCFIIGSTPDLTWTTPITAPGQTLVASANTAIRMVDCEFYAPYADARPVVVSRTVSMTMTSCNFGCPGSLAMVTLADPDGTIITANLKMFGNHYEGGSGEDSTIFLVEASGVISLRGLTDLGSTIVGEDDMSFLDYARTIPGNLLVLEECHIVPGRSLGLVTGLNLYADIADRCVLDWTNIGTMGAIHLFTQAEKSMLRGAVLRVISAVDTDLAFDATTQPVAGVFPKGAFIRNRDPASGEVLGWVALHGGSFDTDPANRTAVTNNTSVIVMNGAYPIYEGARLWIGGFGYAVVRKIVGTSLYMSATIPLTAPDTPIYFSYYVDNTPPAMSPSGIVGGIRGAAVANAAAAPTQAEFNALLTSLRNANLLAT